MAGRLNFGKVGRPALLLTAGIQAVVGFLEAILNGRFWGVIHTGSWSLDGPGNKPRRHIQSIYLSIGNFDVRFMAVSSCRRYRYASFSWPSALLYSSDSKGRPFYSDCALVVFTLQDPAAG